MGLMVAAIILCISSLINYIEHVNRVLRNFLESVRYSDFTRNFSSKGKGSSFDSLMISFNEVIKDFKKIKAEKERHYFYLHTVLQHMEISMIAYQPNGDIEWINDASKRLFHIDRLNNISELSEFSSELVALLPNIQKDDKALLKVIHNDDILQLSIFGTSFNIEGREVRLVSLKNIQYELEDNEIESWQKLIRVLTHEIMNSITPISSLSETVNKTLVEFSTKKEERFSEDEKEDLADISMALKTISKRSVGLLHFVDTYRSLTKIPKPNFSIFNMGKLINNVVLLFKNELKEKHIELIIKIEPPEMNLSADEQLIEQVIINIIKNAIHALEGRENAVLEIRAFINEFGRKSIIISDNGVGILPEVLERIFIPFFTTKSNGSGIGLSLSKQILRLHTGTITASSVPNTKTRFTLVF
jgi:nitrogen fixation/metabolism regulation signal transduction histidine kinase